ncbi:MAG: SGNH/GDSL hydrolase family protein [Pseudomonadota bacterium]
MNRGAIGSGRGAWRALAAGLVGLCFLAPLPAGAEGLLARIGCGTPVIPLDPPAGADAVVLVIGSSSTAGTGAGEAPAYPEVAGRLTGLAVRALGVGGETASGALARLPALLAAHRPAVVVWQVGTNDARAGVPPAALAATLDAGIAAARGAGARVILLDPQFYPRAATDAAYRAAVATVAAAARRHGTGLVTRFARMEDAGAEIEALLAGDRFHMNAAGHACLGHDLAAALDGAAHPPSPR